MGAGGDHGPVSDPHERLRLLGGRQHGERRPARVRHPSLPCCCLAFPPSSLPETHASLPLCVGHSAASEGSHTASTPDGLPQCRREFLALAAPSGDGPAEVADVDEGPDGAAAAAAAEAAPRVPFWLQPPSEEDSPQETVAAAWRHFEGRPHMVGIAQAWQYGLRFILAEPGIPPTGISTADMRAARCALPSHLLLSPLTKGFDLPWQDARSSAGECSQDSHQMERSATATRRCTPRVAPQIIRHIIKALLRCSESCSVSALATSLL